MSGSIFTLDPAQGESLGMSPGHSGVKMNASQPSGGGVGPGTFHITLEDGTGVILLEDGTGDIELENGP